MYYFTDKPRLSYWSGPRTETQRKDIAVDALREEIVGHHEHRRGIHETREAVGTR